MRTHLLGTLGTLGLLALAVSCREDAYSPTAPTTEPALALATTTAALAFRQVSVGAGHACGVIADGRAYCWGSNESGELGDGTIAESTAPVAVAGGYRFRSVSAGRAFTCGVTTEDRVYCWGHNPYGELGIGTTGPEYCFAGIECSTKPMRLAGGLRFRESSAGQDHACAVTTDSHVYCWGLNGFGQLGDGTTTGRLAPVAVARSVRFSHVDAGNYHTCGVTTQHHAYCWGENSYGQLGTRGGGRDWQHTQLRPTVAAGGLKFTQVNAGYFVTCGVTTDDRAYCWGKNGPELGSMSPGDYDFERVPRLVAGGLAFRTVDPSYAHTCGVTTSNLAYCWGVLGNLSESPTPVQVAGGLRFRQVSTGYYNACGVTTDDQAYCWGGDNLTPTPVAGVN
jgi:alpha-tubulin suppressor-like RCC1 family protein